MPKETPAPSAFRRFMNFWKSFFGIFYDLFSAFRFLFFTLYFFTVIVRFWLWLLENVIALLRWSIRLTTIPVALIAGLPKVSKETEVELVNQFRLDVYYAIFAEFFSRWRENLLGFRDWILLFFGLTTARKFAVLLYLAFFVAIPLMYFVPRENNVYIVNENSLTDKVSSTGQTSYLIIGSDLDTPGKPRAYRNEDAWWLGKFNSQGLKSKIRPGKKYRLRVVGLRLYVPVVYPNIISAQEIVDPASESNAESGSAHTGAPHK